MPIFSLPMALFGLLSLPTLAGIYWLRNRYRKRTVSSLMLWHSVTPAKEGGTRVNRLQTPLLFLLELLVLLLLVLAATGPRMLISSSRLPVIVVLDDSFSMLAGGDESPRRAAIESIRRRLETGRYTMRFITAGDEARVISDDVTDPDEAEALLANWRCQSPRGSLPRGISLALEVGGEIARILLVTDHPPAENAAIGERVQWHAFGKSTSNIGFVGASRTTRKDDQMCLFEIVNFSDSPTTAELKLEWLVDGADPAPIGSPLKLKLRADEKRDLFIPVTPSIGTIRASLGDDALDTDNQVVLLRQEPRAVRVSLGLNDSQLTRHIQHVIRVIPGIEIVTTKADLLITDAEKLPTLNEHAATWTSQLISEDPTSAYIGPFVVDHAHPLTTGFSLEGLVWAAGNANEMSGGNHRSLLAAGNVTLLDVRMDDVERHHIRMRYRLDASTLHASNVWPVLFFNLVDWRRAHLPGVEHPNLRVGESVIINLTAGGKALSITQPDGQSREQPLAGRRLRIPAEQPGIASVKIVEDDSPFKSPEWQYAANLLDGNESNLRSAGAVEVGDWSNAKALRWSYQSVAWSMGLLAAVMLALHLMFMARRSSRTDGGGGVS